MAGFILFGPTHHLLTSALRLRALRHELLVGNIANLDTPGYRPRDLDFANTLRTLTLGHAGVQRVGDWGAGMLAFTAAQPRSLVRERGGEEKLDGNGVDLDRELSLLVENTLLHETSLTLLARTLAGLRYAISEGKR
ncbi:MAG: flagellar basal body rod protein FlgB [Candidatus Binatia bacterium]|nr:flagellar basal body rod protein FlgB [Candidatus Binatia bacterium]